MEPNWLAIARRELGVEERAGDADNPRIVEYHAATGLHASDDETPWCGSFVAWCLKQAGIKDHNAARGASARSWMAWGAPEVRPRIGAIAVFSRGSNPAQGHVGFYVGEQGGDLLILGGNQSNAVTIALQSRSRLLGYRWPMQVTDLV